jgi:uncharacterized membrane protein (UPF0127 family)
MSFRSRLCGSVLAAGVALAMLSARAGAQKPAPSVMCQTAQTANPTPVAVRAPDALLELRVADTITKREYGLMCVRSLPVHTGMIFVYRDGDNMRSYWMKNTLIPLDMIWVLKNGRVDTVHAHVPSTTVDTPDDKIPTRTGTGSYVIELAAGEAAKAGIKPGAMLDVSAVPPSKDQ